MRGHVTTARREARTGERGGKIAGSTRRANVCGVPKAIEGNMQPASAYLRSRGPCRRVNLMAQDTRKDPRAKVLSMTVRYKSATVDEFIEHHSHDVSRGGIFIKTPSPFPPGTLLKFEIRIQEEQSVLAGVGRVDWKRDSGESSSD